MSETLSKKDIAEKVAEKTGLSQLTVKKVMDFFIAEIKNQFMNGNKVEIRQFGTFYPHFKSAREYKIPKTGERGTAEARITLRFKTSKHLYIFGNGHETDR